MPLSLLLGGALNMSALEHANVTVTGAVCLPGCVRVRSCVSGDRETEGSHTQPGSDNLAAGNAGASVKEVPRCILVLYHLKPTTYGIHQHRKRPKLASPSKLGVFTTQF